MTVSKKSMDTIDAEWLEIQAAQQNPAKFGVLYNRYYEAIFRFIYRRTSNEQLSADLCSQAFLKAMQNIKSYKHKGVPFSAWLYRIASNEVAQHYRKTQKNRVVSIEDEKVSEIAEEFDAPLRESYREAMIALLDELPIADVEILELRFFENRPFKEIAEILGISESNAKVKTYRLLNRMKKKLTQ